MVVTKIYRVGLLIDGQGGKPLAKAALWVENGRIKEVIPAGSDLPAGIDVVDLAEYTVIPGLIDMHMHVDYWHSQPNVAEFAQGEGLVACLAARNIRSTLEKGVTTLRDVSSTFGLQMRRAVELGFIPGSRIFSAAKGICMTGGHGHDTQGVVQADGPEEIRKAVRQQIRAGADLIKILTSHRSETPEYRQEELDAGVDEAHRLGYRVACHAAIMPAAKMAVLAGIDTLEHGTHLTDEVRELMAERGTYLVPTMIAYHSMGQAARSVIADPLNSGDYRRTQLAKHADWWIKTDEMLESQFRKAVAAGLKITTGTDIVIPDVEFASLHTELELMVKFGYSEMDTICAATRVAAEALGKSADLGTITKGKIADFVAVRGNPLENIFALRNLRMVVKDGSVEIPVPVPYFK
ncbi:MAG: hypothetical protein FD169_1023 [Bacillota bacterium]|nr:MAG: hypothetical protein FD169_1023 [Bacillota bacterium]